MYAVSICSSRHGRTDRPGMKHGTGLVSKHRAMSRRLRESEAGRAAFSASSSFDAICHGEGLGARLNVRRFSHFPQKRLHVALESGIAGTVLERHFVYSPMM